MKRQLVCCLLTMFACTGREDSASSTAAWRAEWDTVGDTIIVRTVSGSIWSERATLVPRVTIGVAEGDENLMLGDIRGLAVGPDGSIYIAEGGPSLKKFGPDGQFIRTIGRVGSGPGEFRRPDGGLAVLPDGRVVLRDPGNGRLAVFSPEGEPLTTWRISSGLNTSRRLYADTAGNVYTLVLVDPEAQVDEWVMGLLRFTPDGTSTDTLRAPTWRFDESVIKAEREGSSSINEVPFSADDSWTFSPLGYYAGGVSTSYRIDLFRPGSPLRIERSTPPIPVLPEEAADHKRVASENMERNYPGWVWNGPDVPRVKPPFREVYAGDDGRIWVRVSTPGFKDSTATREEGVGSRTWSVPTWQEAVAFDVFDAEGQYLGAVDAPAGFQSWPEPVFRGDTVWAAVEDEDGVKYIQRLELVRAPAQAAK